MRTDWMIRLGGMAGLWFVATGCLTPPDSTSVPPVECGEPCNVDELRCDPEGSGAIEICRFNIDGTGCFGFETVEECGGQGGTCEDAECVFPQCPDTACTVGETTCAGDQALSVCEADPSDPLGCGALVERACGAGEVCVEGVCQADCELECTVGTRTCSPQGTLIECVAIELDTEQECSVFRVIEECAAVEGGVCDTVALECTTDMCTLDERDCLPDGTPRRCEEVPGGALDWVDQDACTGSQLCIDGECLCDNACDTLGEVRCADDGKSIVECQMVDGCRTEVAIQTCDGPTVCQDGGDGALICDCPEVDPMVRDVGAPCFENNPRSGCTAQGETRRCSPVSGYTCFVWTDDTKCSAASGGYECRSNNEVRRCVVLDDPSGTSCFLSTTRACVFGQVCVEDGMGGADCF